MRICLVIAALAAMVQPAAYAQVTAVAASGAAELRFRFPNTGGTLESMVLHRFLLDGHPLGAANALEVRRLAEGVTEVTAPSAAAGEWEFAVEDHSGYY